MKILTEIKEITTKCSGIGGIYLRWVNERGGIDQWYFQGNYISDLNEKSITSYEIFIDDLLNQTKNFEVIDKLYTAAIRINTTFDKDNAEGFRQFFSSKMVEMFYGLGVWKRVIVSKETFDVQKMKPLGKLTALVLLPILYNE